MPSRPSPESPQRVSALADQATPSRRAWRQIPKPRPNEEQALLDALGELVDYRDLQRKARARREAHLRRVLALPRLRARAIEDERRQYELRAAEVGFARWMASTEPLDKADVGLLDVLASLDGSVARAGARVAEARAALVAARGVDAALRTERYAPTSAERKRAFHHGELREAAIRVAVERTRAGGPLAVTLRGVARELGVTAPALMYHFRNLEGFRSAVGAAILEQLAMYAGTSKRSRRPPHRFEEYPVVDALAPRPARGPTWVHDLADGWLDYAVENPDLYRQMMGEGWHRPGIGFGVNPGGVATPRRHLSERAEERLGREQRRDRGAHADAAPGLARRMAITIHGLALACIDGAPEEDLRPFVDGLAAAAAS